MKLKPPILSIVITLSIFSGVANAFEIPSSFNPVGSGARALAMGGAYMNVCSDGTAASWNPACLVRVKDYELAMVYSFVHRKENNYFSKNESLSNVGRISQSDANFVGAVIPFKWQRQMAFSFSYQHLYDMSREWDFWNNRSLNQDVFNREHITERQKGGLTAVSLAYGVQINTKLTLGATLNFWNNDLSENKWQQIFHSRSKLIDQNKIITFEYRQIDQFTFKGHNFNIGLLYRFDSRFYAGAVIKTPFCATIQSQRDTLRISPTGERTENTESSAYDLDMPLSYGLGFMMYITNRFRLSFDAYCTRWDQFIQTIKTGEEQFPLTNAPIDEVDIDPTYQFRLGTEYLYEYKKYYIPVRMGILYDPAPSDGNPDEFWGISCGIGLTKNHRYSFDIAYQYRYGNDIQTVDLEHLGFSQDISEHSVYVSMIFYWGTGMWENDED